MKAVSLPRSPKATESGLHRARGGSIHDNADYADLGSDYFERRTGRSSPPALLLRQLEALGNKVTIEPAA